MAVTLPVRYLSRLAFSKFEDQSRNFSRDFIDFVLEGRSNKSRTFVY